MLAIEASLIARTGARHCLPSCDSVVEAVIRNSIGRFDLMTSSEQPLTVIPVPAFKDNYLWLLVRGNESGQVGGNAVVVDPGDAPPVEAALARHGLRLRAILLTHHHADHVGGVQALIDARRGEDLAVYGPAGESIDGVTRTVRDGDCIVLDALGISFDVIDVPGHTRGHIAYYGGPEHLSKGDGDPLVFCGDTLFAAGCGRLFEGTPQQMHASLSKLAALPSNTRVYCAHEYTLANLRFARTVEPGNPALIARERGAIATRERGAATLPSTIGLERATNPFLRSDEPTVRQAADQRKPGAGASALETFTAIRQWKDSF